MVLPDRDRDRQIEKERERASKRERKRHREQERERERARERKRHREREKEREREMEKKNNIKRVRFLKLFIKECQICIFVFICITIHELRLSFCPFHNTVRNLGQTNYIIPSFYNPRLHVNIFCFGAVIDNADFSCFIPILQSM